jgi:hypothetical protein
MQDNQQINKKEQYSLNGLHNTRASYPHKNHPINRQDT